MSKLLPGGGCAMFHARQLAFVLSRAQITVGLAGIRGGKTHAGAFKTLMYAMTHPCMEDEVHLVCSPTYPMSRVPLQKLLKMLYDKSLFPICPLIKYIKSERLFILSAMDGTVTRIQIVSMHDPDKIRGIKALSAWLDEGAYMTAYAWEVIQGRLADSHGPCWITTTPDGYNFIFELYEQAIAERDAGVPLDEREVRFLHWTSYDNTFIKQSGITSLAGQYDSRALAQEVEAKFVKQAGLVYHAFGKHNLQLYSFKRDRPVYVGQDFNVMRMATTFSQPINTEAGPGMHTFHERMADNTNTFELAAYLDRWCSEHSYPKERVLIYADASGSARKTTGKTDHRILKEAGFKVHRQQKNPFVKDRVNCMNGLLTNRNGKGARLLIDPGVKGLIESLKKQVWDTDKSPPEPDKKHGWDHALDAEGYKAWGRFPLRTQASLGAAIRKAA